MTKKKDSTRWNVPVPKTLNEIVEKAVQLDTHSTKADLIREAVREKLAKMGYNNEPFKESPT